MSRIITTVFVLFLILILASCTAAATDAQATLPPGESAVPSADPGLSPAPGSTADIEPIPTTAPDPIDTSEPEPEPSPTPSVVPAGIVKNSGVIIGTDVAFRREPNTDSEVLTRLNKGTYVQILKTNVDAQWHQVKYNGETGYINRIFICLDSSLDGYKLDYVATIVNCKNDVNVRSGPSTDAEVLGVATKGSTLTIIPQDEHTDGWYQVKLDGKTGYIHADYLDIEAKADNTQLTSLTVTGGTLYPSFSPNEYGYVVKAMDKQVTLHAKANGGVDIDINGTGQSSATVEVSSMKTVRIAVNGEIKYSVYIARNVLTVGTWNIKRGGGNLLMQGRLVYDQQPDIMGIQEAFQNLGASDIVDNLASLKTRSMPYNILSPTIEYSNGSDYGNGLISRYKLRDIETFPLDSGSYEKRLLQKAVVDIDGKAVSIYNTHFTYNTASIRAKQFAQVKKIMDDDDNKYKILTGDFNAGFKEFSLFNKGYTVINSTETKYYDYSKNEINYNEIDNIIVSDNIRVINSRIVVTKFSDHCPVFAYLALE